MAVSKRTQIQEPKCQFVVRRAGKNADGTPLGPTYGGDTTQCCDQPGHEEPRQSSAGPILVMRCAEHTGQ